MLDNSRAADAMQDVHGPQSLPSGPAPGDDTVRAARARLTRRYADGVGPVAMGSIRTPDGRCAGHQGSGRGCGP